MNDEKLNGIYASSNESFEFRSGSKVIHHHFLSGSKQVSTYSVKNNKIEIINPFGAVLSYTIINKNTIRSDNRWNNGEIYVKQ